MSVYLPFLALIPVVIIGAIFAVVIMRTLRSARREDEQLGRWYGLGDWQPIPVPPSTNGAPPKPYIPGGLAGIPYRKRLDRALRGHHRGFTAIAYEYSYRLFSPLGASTGGRRRYTIMVIGLPGWCPRLDVSATRKGSGDTGDPAFDAVFDVAAADPQFARYALPPALRQWLLADPRATYFPIQIEGTAISTRYAGGCAPETLGPMVDYLVDWCTRLPAGLWRG